MPGTSDLSFPSEARISISHRTWEFVNPQDSSPLFNGRIPAEIRNVVFEFALAEFVAPALDRPSGMTSLPATTMRSWTMSPTWKVAQISRQVTGEYANMMSEHPTSRIVQHLQSRVSRPKPSSVSVR